MGRCWLALVLVPVVSLPCALAQSASKTANARTKTETFYGLRLATVPEVLYSQLPKLPRGQGVLVEQVQPNSPASHAGLKLYDIVLSVSGKDIKDSDQFANLLRMDKPVKVDRSVQLVVLRAGKEMTLEVGQAALRRIVDPETSGYFRGNVKNGRPPAVSCKATAIGNNKIEVTFEYYPDGKGKLQKQTYSGSLEQIETKVNNLPKPVQDLARVALKRLRARQDR
jgi:hypothetical protein